MVIIQAIEKESTFAREYLLLKSTNIIAVKTKHYKSYVVGDFNKWLYKT